MNSFDWLWDVMKKHSAGRPRAIVLAIFCIVGTGSMLLLAWLEPGRAARALLGGTLSRKPSQETAALAPCTMASEALPNMIGLSYHTRDHFFLVK